MASRCPHYSNVFWLSVLSLAGLCLLYFPAYQRASQDAAAHSGSLLGWTVNTSRDIRLYVLPENTTTILVPSEPCPPKLFLLTVVCSAVSNVEARMAIRETWGSVANSSQTEVRILFLLGESENSTLQDMVVEESRHFGDIVQEAFMDSYNNLTLKTVLMLKWTTSQCPSAHFIMKTDDDMYVNVGALLALLRERGGKTLLLGSLICGAKPIRDKQNKWYSPRYMFPGRLYPNYLSGTGYVMSQPVARRLYEVSLVTPLFHLEDVFLTGFCARLAGIRPRDHPAFTYLHRSPEPCLYAHRSVVTSHHVGPVEMRKVWGKLHDPSLDCSNFAPPTPAHGKPSSGRGKVSRKSAPKCI